MPWFKAFLIKSDFEINEYILTVKIEGKVICILFANNEVHAFQNSCPHAGGSLCAGWLDQENIVCPNHHYKYNYKTGKGQGMQGDFINIYETKWIDNELYIKVPYSLNPFRWLMKLFE